MQGRRLWMAVAYAANGANTMVTVGTTGLQVFDRKRPRM
jgi:hypothetical protein